MMKILKKLNTERFLLPFQLLDFAWEMFLYHLPDRQYELVQLGSRRLIYRFLKRFHLEWLCRACHARKQTPHYPPWVDSQ